jgi:hypothetical protein
MLTKLGKRGYAIGEMTSEYFWEEIDSDTDSAPDTRETVDKHSGYRQNLKKL